MSAESRRKDGCKNDAHQKALAEIGPRDVNLRPFREACFELLTQLDDLGENTESEKAEQQRIALINTLEGVLEDTGCDQGMIGHF